MIACDFCPLHWHLDCLDPATTTAPTSSKKWMCPCHKQHLDIRRRVPRHWAGHQAVSPIPFPSPFFVACETEGADEAKEAAADTVSVPQGGRKRVKASHDEHTTDDEPLAAVPVFRFQYMNHIFLTSVDAMDRDASSSPPLPSPTVSSTPSSSTPTPTPTTSATAAPNAKQPRTGGIRRKRRYFV
ncbi:hypothetical protein BC940DRAFT_295371 [Gongronella butleri]|nr:hypothetical protein BC940DRAFT_295371 [Gongronella butleri]